MPVGSRCCYWGYLLIYTCCCRGGDGGGGGVGGGGGSSPHTTLIKLEAHYPGSSSVRVAVVTRTCVAGWLTTPILACVRVCITPRYELENDSEPHARPLFRRRLCAASVFIICSLASEAAAPTAEAAAAAAAAAAVLLIK